MSVTTGPSPRRSTRSAELRRDAARRDQLALLAELRDVDHWRRLVSARLDLAVAAVADVDEPVVRSLPAATAPSSGLRQLVGLPAQGAAHAEIALLDRLRTAQRELDDYARALRAATRAATVDIVSRLDDRRPEPGRGPERCAGPAGAGPAGLAPVLPLRRRRPGRGGPDDVA